MELYKILVQIPNFVYNLHHELPNDLRLRKLGKPQNCMGTQSSVQSLLEKGIFGSSA